MGFRCAHGKLNSGILRLGHSLKDDGWVYFSLRYGPRDARVGARADAREVPALTAR